MFGPAPYRHSLALTCTLSSGPTSWISLAFMYGWKNLGWGFAPPRREDREWRLAATLLLSSENSPPLSLELSIAELSLPASVLARDGAAVFGGSRGSVCGKTRL